MADNNLTMEKNINGVREVDFATRFGYDLREWADIFNSSRFVEKQPGTLLTYKKAEVELQDGKIGEGEKIPYSQATVTETPYDKIIPRKYKKGTTFEAVAEHGYDIAIQSTDEALLRKIESKIVTDFMDFALTGTLTLSETDFQMAVAMFISAVESKWEEMDKHYSQLKNITN